MNKQVPVKSVLNTIPALLAQKKLKKAFDLFSYCLSQYQNWQLKEHLFELEDHYKLMLNYLVQGVKDPKQEVIYNDLLRSVYQLYDQLQVLVKTDESWSYYYQNRKIHSQSDTDSVLSLKEAIDDIQGKLTLLELLDEGDAKQQQLQELAKRNEEVERKVFYKIWLSDPWHTDEGAFWSSLLKNQLNSQPLNVLIIVALTLSLQEVFDERKILLLLEASESENEEIRQRALIGLLISLYQYDSRLYLYPQIGNRLQALKEHPDFVREVRNILFQFVLSKDTEKVTQKIKNEIIPEMLKASPQFRGKLNMDEWLNDLNSDEKNPEWQSILEKSGLTDKLQEFSEMQLEGVDVMHSSFIHLKNYAFFNEFSHWFLPFSLRADMMNDREMTSVAEMLTKSAMLCNSDKYSFYYSIGGMPEAYRKMMTSQLSAESEAMQQMMKEEIPNDKNSISVIARQYIQDLYRFYKLNPRKADFRDVFSINPEFYKVNSIAELISDEESLTMLGEHYFNRNYYQEASDVFSILSAQYPGNEILYQKNGYCMQMLGHFPEALENYLKAELLNAQNPWTIKKIAYCYRLQKNYAEALEYYKKAEVQNPDNLAVQLSIGHCLLELKDYDEALKRYFKVEYLSEKKEKTWRPIAWCSFLVGKFQQAMDYYARVLSEQPTANDYLNAGHTQLAMGNTNEAIPLYVSSLKAFDNSADKFNEAFNNDLPELLQAGVASSDIPFILDKVVYEA